MLTHDDPRPTATIVSATLYEAQPTARAQDARRPVRRPRLARLTRRA